MAPHFSTAGQLADPGFILFRVSSTFLFIDHLHLHPGVWNNHRKTIGKRWFNWIYIYIYICIGFIDGSCQGLRNAVGPSPWIQLWEPSGRVRIHVGIHVGIHSWNSASKATSAVFLWVFFVNLNNLRSPSGHTTTVFWPSSKKREPAQLAAVDWWWMTIPTTSPPVTWLLRWGDKAGRLQFCPTGGNGQKWGV